MSCVQLSAVFFCTSLVIAIGLAYWIMQSGAALDLPNERSLHHRPVPRGGGAAIILVVLLAVPAAGFWFPFSADVITALCGVGLLLGVVGWLDDKCELPIGYRLTVQITAALLVIVSIGPLPRIDLAGISLSLGWLGAIFTLLWIVWMSNLYNFMDGIDGLAAVETLVSALVLAFWFGTIGESNLALVCSALAGGTLGFLWFNRPPARLFLGDVGSATLGGLFATLAVLAVVRYDLPLGAFIILFSYFIYDATVTLLRRWSLGEKWWRPHRSHLYQRAVRAGLGHGVVTLAVFMVNLVLAGLATLELQAISPRPLWAVLAMLLLITLHLEVRVLERRAENSSI